MGTCLINFLNNIYGELDEGGACEVLFLDLSKAFDTVDHNNIEIKLKSLGLKESCIAWFNSQLENRIHYTHLHNVVSDLKHTSSSMPQGSILGLLLFVCYISDMPNFCGDLQPFIYADDTALLGKNQSLDVINNTLRNGLDSISNWFCAQS